MKTLKPQHPHLTVATWINSGIFYDPGSRKCLATKISKKSFKYLLEEV